MTWDYAIGFTDDNDKTTKLLSVIREARYDIMTYYLHQAPEIQVIRDVRL